MTVLRCNTLPLTLCNLLIFCGHDDKCHHSLLLHHLLHTRQKEGVALTNCSFSFRTCTIGSKRQRAAIVHRPLFMPSYMFHAVYSTAAAKRPQRSPFLRLRCRGRLLLPNRGKGRHGLQDQIVFLHPAVGKPTIRRQQNRALLRRAVQSKQQRFNSLRRQRQKKGIPWMRRKSVNREMLLVQGRRTRNWRADAECKYQSIDKKANH